MNFANRLKELLEESKLSIRDLSTKLKYKGCTTIYEWLNDKYLPSLEKLNELANIFNCSFEYLLGRTEQYLYVKEQALKPFGNQLIKILKNTKSSQYKMREFCKISSCSIHKWLKEDSLPSVTNLIKMSEFLNISIDFLVGRD